MGYRWFLECENPDEEQFGVDNLTEFIKQHHDLSPDELIAQLYQTIQFLLMKHLISLSVFLIVGILVIWSITSNYNDTDRIQQSTSTDYAEIFMNKFEMTSMGLNGKPDYIVNGDYLQRANDSDDTKIKQPLFHLYQENKHWEVSAKSAIIKDDVYMQQKDIEPAVTIRTQYLMIHTNTQIARTKSPVIITHGRSRITSDGMVLNNKTSKLELSSNVNGHYSPHD